MPKGVTARMQVIGLRELGENFKMLSEEVQGKIARKAVREATTVVANFARLNHPNWDSETGLLASSIIAFRSSKESKYGVEVWAVGVKGLQKAYVNNVRNRRSGKTGYGKVPKQYTVEGGAYYWKFLEYGTVKMPVPRPFMGPALDANKGKATDIIARELANGIRTALRAIKNPASSYVSYTPDLNARFVPVDEAEGSE